MLAQPFVENAIEQGIFGTGLAGEIVVTIREDESNILIEVTDNGIGRIKVKEQSNQAATSLDFDVTRITEERITNLNRKYRRKIKLQVTNLFDESMNPTGTKVLLIIPEQKV